MTNITLHLRHEDKLCDADTRAVLAATLTPFDQAKPGDFIAFNQSVYVPINDRSPSGGRHQVFYRKTDDGAEWVKYRDLVKEDHPKLAELAHLSLMVIDDKYFDRAADQSVRDMNDSEDTFWADVLFFPSEVMIVTRDDFEVALEEKDCETLDEVDDISGMIQVITPKFDSAHEKVEAIPALKNALAALSAIGEQDDADGDRITFSIDIE